MLRRSLITIAILVLILGAAGLTTGVLAPGVVIMLWATVFLAAILFERHRYKRLAATRPGPGWERTTERFIDEETGKIVTVYLKPETGERTYVAE